MTAIPLDFHQVLGVIFVLTAYGSIFLTQCAKDSSRRTRPTVRNNGQKSIRASSTSVKSSKQGRAATKSALVSDRSSKKANLNDSKKTIKKTTEDTTQTVSRTLKASKEEDWSKRLATDLHVEMRDLKFSEEGGLVKLPIHNPTKFRFAYKIKTSDNNIFRVSPVYGFVEPKETVYLNVLRAKGPSKVDRLIIEVAKVNYGKGDIKTIFTGSGRFAKIALPMSA